MTHPLTDQQLDEIEARATSEHLTPGPWRPEYEQCDCSDGYCHHGAYVASVHAPTPTESAAERCKRTREEPRDYDFSRTEMGDFSTADWELMAHARTDVPALLAEVRRLNAELAKEQRLHGDTIDDRDRAQDAADKLAYAVASETVIGEHTADNSPWANALELVTSAAEVDELRALVATPVVAPSKDTPLSEYDFVELVAFASKVESEGFGYAYEEYPPRFEAPELAPIADDYSLLRQLFDEWQEAVDEFWTRSDAEAVYDAHIDEARRRREQRSAAAVTGE